MFTGFAAFLRKGFGSLLGLEEAWKYHWMRSDPAAAGSTESEQFGQRRIPVHNIRL